MRRAIVHVGLPKTGSSALQSFLDSSVILLSEKHYFYQATPFSSNTIHSGNGGPLFVHASNNHIDLLSQAINSLLGPPDSITIISCELFCHLNDQALSNLVESLSSHFDTITYIGYVRSVSSCYYSEYTQSLKRHEETRSFRGFVKETCLNAYSFPRRLGMHVRNTDSIRFLIYPYRLDFCIIMDFLRFLGVPELLPHSRPSLNRSLTPFESQLFRFLNLHRQFSSCMSIDSAVVSDLYLQMQQDGHFNTPLLTCDVLNLIHDRHCEEIKYINTLLPEDSMLMTLDQEKIRLETLSRVSMVEIDGLLLEEIESQNVRSLIRTCEVYKNLLCK